MSKRELPSAKRQEAFEQGYTLAQIRGSAATLIREHTRLTWPAGEERRAFDNGVATWREDERDRQQAARVKAQGSGSKPAG